MEPILLTVLRRTAHVDVRREDEQMKTPIEQQNGIVAILDALGAATYNDAEVERFL